MDVAEEDYLFELSSDLDSTADDFQIKINHLLAIWLLLPEQRECNAIYRNGSNKIQSVA